MHLVYLVGGGAVLFLLALATDPKSKYGFVAFAVAMFMVGCYFWPQLRPALAARY